MIQTRFNNRTAGEVVDNQDAFNIYQSAMNETNFPAHPTADEFADLYEKVTGRYDEYRHTADGVEQLRDWITDEFPSLPTVLDVALSEQQLDIRAVVWLCETFGWTLEDVRQTVCGKNTSFVYQKLVTLEDLFQLQSFLKGKDWVVGYGELRQWMGATGTKFHGRSVSRMGDCFGATVVRLDGSDVARYQSVAQGTYGRNDR